MLEFVGLGKRLSHKPGELSGGELQRVAIARALAKKPSILLMDEPTGNVDSTTRDVLLDLILRINQKSDLTIVIATHDQDIAKFCHRTVELLDGEVVEVKTLRSKFESEGD